jgi:hypothetical protein
VSRVRRPSPDLDAAFDAELRRAARALVREDLPPGILGVGHESTGGRGAVVRPRQSLPAYAAVAAAVVLLLGTALALVPGGVGPSPSPTSIQATPTTRPETTLEIHGTLRSSADIRADFERLGYVCQPGNPVLPVGPSSSVVVREGVVCAAPVDAGPDTVAAIAGEAADGRVVEFHAKADIVGTETAAAREAVAASLAKAAAIAASGPGSGNQLAAWVTAVVPSLGRSSSNSSSIAGFSIKVVRSSSGSYQLVLSEA